MPNADLRVGVLFPGWTPTGYERFLERSLPFAINITIMGSAVVRAQEEAQMPGQAPFGGSDPWFTSPRAVVVVLAGRSPVQRRLPAHLVGTV